MTPARATQDPALTESVFASEPHSGGGSILSTLASAIRRHRLAVFGAFFPQSEDAIAVECRTLLLLGPLEPGFWPHVTAQPEFADARPDPLDRWSQRVIGAVAREFGGTALFPFTGPPYHPFQRWALRSGRAWISPVGLLVHESAGLMLSYRGALALPQRLALGRAPDEPPCSACMERPCLSACPVGALSGTGYDVPACHRFLDTPAGVDCMERGCAVRRACPVSADYGRREDQSAWHMRRFHRT